ncbi:RNA polymerase sigma factor (sigma-70 family) [Microbacterium sp. SLBN-154]|uniref:RNA polymerase sigma factor n=1 Tax=Microbacterium sp. SLBN-154 TaxID=2768458 RepID=UPI00116B8EEC|nr:sigma-70 family RNA polymerase sigma factor [Microbacterium sp. SLBN-154]TQK17958.1 RNA polymerase sigma factor (sigma-70 family) [Microbacterium sp. SLBN-154]
MNPAPLGAVTAAARSAAPRALAVMVRRTGGFDDAEDAVQEALAAAWTQWPREGVPDNPAAWLVSVASRRYVDAVRSDAARRAREERTAREEPGGPVAQVDDTLRLFLLCCHPSLSRASQMALTLRCVGGLTTREIARGLLSTESTVAQRISRAKASLRGVTLDAGGPLADRVPVLLDVLSLIHTEAHSAAEGEEIARPLLGAEALRLARLLLSLSRPGDPWRPEAMGLVALMLLTDARGPARVDGEGVLIPLAQQDRTRWRADLIAEGAELLTAALALRAAGRYQVRAAIAAVHDEAATAADTDWRQILGLYEVLRRLDPGPVSELGRAVAMGEVAGPAAGLQIVAAWEGRASPLRVAAVRAHLLDRAGRTSEARREYERAAGLTRNGAERRWFLDAAGAP